MSSKAPKPPTPAEMAQALEESNKEHLKTMDRTMFQFQMNNLAEMCFNHVYTRKEVSKEPATNELKQAQIDLCIHKYMQAYKLVNNTVRAEAKSSVIAAPALEQRKKK